MTENSNLAKELDIQLPVPSPEIPDKRVIHKPLPRKSGLTKIEKGLICFLSVIAFSLLAVSISLQISIASINRNVQDTNSSISEVTIVNKNLEQEVQELSRYDRVYKIANEYGLEMNEENVRNVRNE